MTLTHDDVREILAIIDASPPAEIQVQTDGFSLHVLIGDGTSSAAARQLPPLTQPASATGGRSSADTTPAPEPPVPADAGTDTGQPVEGLETIESPMLGTFYRAESPGSEPFVEVGSVIEADTLVCIIEVMKMMNSVTAGAAGTIVEILAENAQLVEFGEPLFRVEPA